MKKLAFVPIVLLCLLCALLASPTLQAATTTEIVGGLTQPRGSDYVISRNQSIFAERGAIGAAGAGRIWRINMVDLSNAVLGTGYNEPMDVAISRVNDRYAYVIENGGGGTLLRVRVNLATANRASATVVRRRIGGVSGHILTQIALDEAHNCAYVVQNSGSGVIWRINLSTGAKLAVLTDIAGTFGTAPGGLVVNKDSTFAYFTTLGSDGKLIRLNLSNGTTEQLLTGLFNPGYLDWANPSENAILVAHRSQISSIDITQSPPVLNPLVTGLNVNTRSVRRISDDRLLISVFNSVYDVSLSPFSSAGPLLLGIGHVPFDRIGLNSPGYADTTGDAGIPLQVKNSPFGGTLDLMINHDRAFSVLGGRWYKVLVDGVEPRQSWSDYLWDTATSRFVVQTMIPDAGGFYPVREPAALWYEHWLGYRLDTSGFSNALHTITVQFYNSAKAPIKGGTSSLQVKIDNRWPTAIISKVMHDGNEVPACAMVATGSDDFTFVITANDPDNNLLSWSLTALWGDNQSAPVASDTYSAHLPAILWSGVTNATVPIAAPWTATETCCAHTFHLSVWDRTINGHNYIHWSGYNKSITIMTGCP